LQLGESGVNTIKSFDASSFSTRIAAEVDFNPEKLLSDYILKSTARFTQFALISVYEAIADAGLYINPSQSKRYGICIGTSRGGAMELVKAYEVWKKQSDQEMYAYDIGSFASC